MKKSNIVDLNLRILKYVDDIRNHTEEMIGLNNKQLLLRTLGAIRQDTLRLAKIIHENMGVRDVIRM